MPGRLNCPTLQHKLASVFQLPRGRYFVVDSFLLAVCKLGRARYCCSFHGQSADYGRCPAKKKTYFGYRVYTLIALESYIASFEVTPASVDDQKELRNLAGRLWDTVILADKSYVGEMLR